MLYNRLLNLSPDMPASVFLFGPRGTGKTSWLKTHLNPVIYYDLLDDEVYTRLLAWPKRIAEDIPEDFKGWIVIDEIQKAPLLLDEVHRLIETRKLRFVLTGSSARKLKQKGVNLLAGRAYIYHMHPFVMSELQGDFSLATAIQYGMLPRIYHHVDAKEYLKSYVSTYLREEVLQEGLTRNLAMFGRFLEIASFSQGEQVNLTEIAREIGYNRHSVANFFEVLEDLLIAVRIYPFTRRAKRAVVSSPKFYFFDTGVFRSIRPMGPLDSNDEIDGAALETLFLQHLRAYNDYYALDYGIYYWRTTTQLEVDFIIYGPKGFHAFEIKRKKNITKKDLKGLLAFKEEYPEVTCYLLYGGNSNYIENAIQILPYETALKQLPKIIGKEI